MRKQEEKERLNRLAAIGEMAAGIAHEVKNPLTAVKGFLELLNEENEHDYLKLASSELDHALSTLNNLLQVARPDLDNEPFTSIHLCSELESILHLFQDQVYRIDFVTKFQHPDKTIFGKRNILKKAFFNLIKNAVEAIPDKGTITIEHFYRDERIWVNIIDTGIGIPDDQIRLIETPFYSTKESGTGMGVTQAFSAFSQHGASVNVYSEVNVGTKFSIQFPVVETKEMEVITLDSLEYVEGHDFRDFLNHNKKQFKEQLNSRTTHSVAENVENSELLSEDRLLENGFTIINCILNDAEHELITLAKDDGVAWAKSDLPAILYLEWFRGFREVYWDFLYNYYRQTTFELDTFFTQEKKTNYLFDIFLNNYFASYNDYKNEMLRSQREIIEELSVPIIPLSKTIAILPVIGSIDTYRAKKIQERALAQIEKLKIKRMILDLSGVAYMDTAVIDHLLKLVDGFKMMGCKTMITGVRSEIVNTMIDMGISLSDKIETFGDLQQVLEEYGITEEKQEV
ncbi:MAG: STAS domain-containing protein [Bacillaceae bacterium]|nr:STAS domain-containing protein [Bacillaceae bacterium]